MHINDILRYIERYLKKLEGDKKSKYTIDNYKSTFRGFKKCINEHPQDKKYDTKSFRDLVFDYIYGLDSEYAINTINAKRAAMKGLVKYIAMEKGINEDFSRDIVRLSIDSGKKREVLTTDEIRMILHVLAEEFKEAEGYSVYYKARNIALFATLLYTGARRSELVGIKWTDIDMMNNHITVLGKNNKTRIIPLRKELKYQLIEFKDTLHILETAGYDVRSDYIFRTDNRSKGTKEKDKPMTPKNVWYIIKDIMAKAGITKNISPHNLRHNFASYFIHNGGRIPTLSGILGHSTSDITMRIYTHEISYKEREQEMEKLDFGI